MGLDFGRLINAAPIVAAGSLESVVRRAQLRDMAVLVEKSTRPDSSRVLDHLSGITVSKGRHRRNWLTWSQMDNGRKHG